MENIKSSDIVSIYKQSSNITEGLYVDINQTTKRTYRDSSRETNKKRRLADLTCVVCEGSTTGHNFSQISCHSCKEFFRRTALLPKDKLKCINKKNARCQIRFDLKRKCPHCRLIKCFESGMRKDLLLTPEDKLLKQRRIEKNRQSRSTQISSATTNQQTTLSTINRSILANIQNAYISALQSSPLPSSVVSFDLTPDKVFSLTDTSELDNLIVMRLVNFIRVNPDFQSLNEQDRFTIVKYNLTPLFILHDIITFDPIRELWHTDNGLTPVTLSDETFAHNCKSLCILTYGYGMMKHYVIALHRLAKATNRDPIIVQLLMLILIFSVGLSYDDIHVPTLIDSRQVSTAHLKYTDLLFRYLIDQSSFEIAVNEFMLLVEQIFDIQKLDQYFHENFKNKININRINPLLASVLRL